MTGWARIYRQIEDNPIWLSEPFSKGQAWIDLIVFANHKNGYFFVRGNKIQIERGQVGWSEVTLSSRWKWSRNKVRRFLKQLETEQQIEQQKNSFTSVITIKNYDRFQSERTADDTAERQQKDSRRYTNKNDKNVKNNNNTHNEFNSLDTITTEVIGEIAKQYSVSFSSVAKELDSMKLYCQSNGKKYKDYRAALQNWVRRKVDEKKIPTVGTLKTSISALLEQKERQYGN